MLTVGVRAWRENREAAGFLVSIVFVCLASVRDVYLAGLFQRTSPLLIAVAAFTLCSLVFLPISFACDPGSLRALLSRPRDLFWINVTSAMAWIAFFYALRIIEPSLVQILFFGIGPLSVVWIDQRIPGAAPAVPLTRAERSIHLGLFASLIFSVAVVIGGLSGAGPQPVGVAAVGVAFAAGAGISISVNTLLCRKVNDAGVSAAALVALRFPGAVILATVLAAVSPSDLPVISSTNALAFVMIALLLIVFPIYVNQVGIALASPLTVRVVLATGPVLLFFLQLIEGRMSASPYSLAAAVLYAVFAISAALARRRAIRSTLLV
jgi:drug/metabolite transporter (DMT)-like permease